MASAFQWDELLQAKYKFAEIEKKLYSENRNKANTPEMYAKFICDNLRPGDVPENLCKLYHEAVYGCDGKVKAHIVKCIYGIGQRVR